jgi:acetylornithine deacetylase/succinyl-diaminopimelate desuccinylase-like protein
VTQYNDRSLAIDESYLIRQTSELAKVSTAVPLGFETLMPPDHPLFKEYVQRTVRPRIQDIGVHNILDVEPNDIVVCLGDSTSSKALLVQTYVAAQHHNLMDDPFSGKIANAEQYGYDEPCIFGQGVSQNKAHQAVMLTVLKYLVENKVKLKGNLYWTINNEAMSTHNRTRAILERLDVKPSFAIIQIGTESKVWLGNRGRVDIDIHLRGKATHSSDPSSGLCAIEGTNTILNRLKLLSWSNPHPELGGRHARAYKIKYEPVAPHTLPSDAYITVDRRLIPGDDPDAAVAEVRNTIGDMSPYEVCIQRGVCTLPAIVSANDPWVSAFVAAGKHGGDGPLETMYALGSFDAGALTLIGIPAVTFGAGAGVYPVGPDFVPISALKRQAHIMANYIIEQLG